MSQDGLVGRNSGEHGFPATGKPANKWSSMKRQQQVRFGGDPVDDALISGSFRGLS